MSKVKRVILINAQEKDIVNVAILENGILEEFYSESKKKKSLVGNIYKGVIEDIVPSLGGCFVNIGMQRKGFLYLRDLEEILEIEKIEKEERIWPIFRIFRFTRKKQISIEQLKGKEVMVQIIKDPYQNKPARLTSHITLASRTLVLVYGSCSWGVSRKIEDQKERKRLLSILKKLKLPSQCGLIARTASLYENKSKIFTDHQYLLNLWKSIQYRFKRRPTPSLIYEELDLTLRILRDYAGASLSEVYVDDISSFKRLQSFCKVFYPHIIDKISYFSQDKSLFDSFGITSQIKQLYSKKVKLECGGYLVIEPTEALTVIDVNSGSFAPSFTEIGDSKTRSEYRDTSKDITSKSRPRHGAKFTSVSSQEEASFYVNKQACKEIARQLRLRNIGGIIVIDFINMKKKEHKEELIRYFRRLLLRDKMPTQILSFTSLGLLEMTRKRERVSFLNTVFRACPCCKGEGKIESLVVVGERIINELKQFSSGKVTLKVHPLFKKYIEENIRNKINLNSLKIFIEEDENIKIDDYSITFEG